MPGFYAYSMNFILRFYPEFDRLLTVVQQPNV